MEYLALSSNCTCLRQSSKAGEVTVSNRFPAPTCRQITAKNGWGTVVQTAILTHLLFQNEASLHLFRYLYLVMFQKGLFNHEANI